MRIVIRRTIVSIISLIAILFFAPLEMVQSLWCKLVLRQNTTISFSLIKEAYAVVLCSVEEAVKTLLPDAQEIKEEVTVLTEVQKETITEKGKIKFNSKLDKEFRFFIGTVNGKITGYAVKDTVKGKWGPIHYMLSLNPEGKIVNVIVLAYKEKRGRPVAKRKFLKQFVGKTINNTIRLNKDIRKVSGATISSRGMTDGIRKVVYIYNELYGNN